MSSSPLLEKAFRKVLAITIFLIMQCYLDPIETSVTILIVATWFLNIHSLIKRFLFIWNEMVSDVYKFFHCQFFFLFRVKWILILTIMFSYILRPLIRIIGDRFPWQVKSAILSTLSIIIRKGGMALKPFLPQLQTTFIKCLQDNTRLVRLFFWSSLIIIKSHLNMMHSLTTHSWTLKSW